MTHRRQQVLAEIAQSVAHGEHVTLASLARRCGLHSYNDARRIMNDLKRIGAI